MATPLIKCFIFVMILLLFSQWRIIMSNNNTPICDFGLHKGEPYTRLPASFLTWMIATNHQKAHYANDELKRRELAATKQRHHG
jgi:hypothetical protein